MSILLQPRLRTWGKATSPAAKASRNPIFPRKKPSGLRSDEALWRAGPTGRPSDRLAWRPVGMLCLQAERESEQSATERAAPQTRPAPQGAALTCGPARPRSRRLCR